MTRIVQISDTHIVAPGELTCGVVDTAAALTAAVDTVNHLLTLTSGIDMVVVTGDLTEHGMAGEYDHFRELLAPLKVPCAVLPGNHDSRAEMRTRFKAPGKGLSAEMEPLNWVVDLPEFTLIGLDSQVPGSHHGQLARETLGFLLENLALAGERPALVALHHPPVPSGIREMDEGGLRDSAVFADIVASHRGEVRIICGHLHRNISGLFGGAVCQVAPGASHAVTLDQRPRSTHSLTREPGAIMLHEWRGGGFISHHVPTGVFDGPHSFG